MSNKLTKSDEPHYLRPLLRLFAEGKLGSAAGLQHIAIRHDQWCRIYRDQACNCNPEIQVLETEGSEKK